MPLRLLDEAPQNAVRLDFALDLCRRHNAHSTSLCPLDVPLPAGMGIMLGGWYPDALSLRYALEQINQQNRERSAPLEADFRRRLSEDAGRELRSGHAGG
jgi:hypothetical protein